MFIHYWDKNHSPKTVVTRVKSNGGYVLVTVKDAKIGYLKSLGAQLFY